MVGMTPKSAKLGPVSPVAAVVDGFGITDVVDLLNGPHHQFWADDWVPPGPARVELARRVSPMTYVRHDLPPIFIARERKTIRCRWSSRSGCTMRWMKTACRMSLWRIVPNCTSRFSREQWKPLDVKIFAFLKAHGIVGPEQPEAAAGN